MKDYFCPVCRSQLRIDDQIALSAKSPENEQGLIFLSAKIGDYSKKTHPDFEIREGEKYKFYCSVCHAQLNDEEKSNMVKIKLEEDGTIYDCYFSNIAGEEVTFKVRGEEVEEYGFHKERRRKYFDVPDEYKKYL